MTAARRALCQHCGLPLATCLCRWITPVGNEVEVLILQHPMEVAHAKGSVRLLRLSLGHCRVEVGEVFDQAQLAGWLGTPASAGSTWLLYPDHAGPPAPAPASTSPDADAGAYPRATHVGRLVVLDGTWRKSLKMLHSNPVLQGLPRLALQPDAPSRYLIRKAAQAHQLSTLEATCLALSQLEGTPSRYAPLLRAFDGFVSAQARRLTHHDA